MKKELIIIGAGAIGRGYLPWVFGPQCFDYIFVDSNQNLISQLKTRLTYLTHRVSNGSLETLRVPVKGAYLPQEFAIGRHRDAACVFVNIGPRNVSLIGKLFEDYQGPIVLCENDPDTVESLKRLTGKKDIFFAVPDVISSNTAPKNLLEEDPLSLVTENGVLFVDETISTFGLRGEFTAVAEKELIEKQWTAKLFLHNTPHCVAAYLGAMADVEYVHESMQIPEINLIVEGAMKEMLSALKLRWEIPHPFLDWYASKELERFRSRLLFDPISRVAREPLRKLQVDGRLIGAAQICLASGFIPQNILLGIASALLFNNQNDPDHHLNFMRKAMDSEVLLSHVIGLRTGEALDILLSERLPKILQHLESIFKNYHERTSRYGYDILGK